MSQIHYFKEYIENTLVEAGKLDLTSEFIDEVMNVCEVYKKASEMSDIKNLFNMAGYDLVKIDNNYLQFETVADKKLEIIWVTKSVKKLPLPKSSDFYEIKTKAKYLDEEYPTEHVAIMVTIEGIMELLVNQTIKPVK